MSHFFNGGILALNDKVKGFIILFLKKEIVGKDIAKKGEKRNIELLLDKQ